MDPSLDSGLWGYFLLWETGDLRLLRGETCEKIRMRERLRSCFPCRLSHRGEVVLCCFEGGGVDEQSKCRMFMHLVPNCEAQEMNGGSLYARQ